MKLPRHAKLFLLSLAFLGFSAFALVPASASAAIFGIQQPTLIVCGGNTPQTSHECTFNDLYRLAQNVMTFLFFLSVPAATLLFCYAGWLYLTAGGSPSNLEKAKGIFSGVAIGFLCICGAWLIVYTIMDALIDRSAYNILEEGRIKIGN